MSKETWLKKGLKTKLVNVLISTVDKQQLEIDDLKLEIAELRKNLRAMQKIADKMRQTMNKRRTVDWGHLTLEEIENLTLKQVRAMQITKGDE